MCGHRVGASGVCKASPLARARISLARARSIAVGGNTLGSWTSQAAVAAGAERYTTLPHRPLSYLSLSPPPLPRIASLARAVPPRPPSRGGATDRAPPTVSTADDGTCGGRTLFFHGGRRRRAPCAAADGGDGRRAPRRRTRCAPRSSTRRAAARTAICRRWDLAMRGHGRIDWLASRPSVAMTCRGRIDWLAS